MKNKLSLIKEELNNSKKRKKNTSSDIQILKEQSFRTTKITSNLKNSDNNLSKNKETIYSKYESQNSYLLSSENNIGDKKITIKDLCPEEKARIGELIKKLAQEKEEKESLRIKLETEKKEYESRLESMVKENLSMFDNSKIFPNNERKPINETVSENSLTPDENKSPILEIKNLREKFNKVYEDLQTSVKVQEDMINSRGNFVDSVNNQSQNILNNNSSILKEEKPYNDPFLNNFNLKNNEEKFSPEVDRELNLNFNYKKESNQRVIHDILSENDPNDYLNSLNSPKLSLINVEENYYNPSPQKEYTSKPNNVLGNTSPKKLQSSLLNFNDEIREDSSNIIRTKDINKEIINNIQIQKQKQTYLISKNKLQNVKEKMKHANNDHDEDQEKYPSEDKQIITRPQKTIKQDNYDLRESQRKLIGSYLQFNVKRVQDLDSDNQESNRSRSISQLNKNIKTFEFPQKKYTNDDNLNQEEEDEDIKVVHFHPKNDCSQTSNNRESRSNSKSKYQEMLCRIKEKCQNNIYQMRNNDKSNNEDNNTFISNNKHDSYNYKINKSVGSETDDNEIPLNKPQIKNNSKLKTSNFEIDKPVDILLSSHINNYKKEDKHTIQIELSSSNNQYQYSQAKVYKS